MNLDVADDFSGVISISSGAQVSVRAGVRTRRPRARHRDDRRHAAGDGERVEGVHRGDGARADRRRRAEPRHDRAVDARQRPAARSPTTSRSSTCSRTARASATTSTRTSARTCCPRCRCRRSRTPRPTCPRSTGSRRSSRPAAGSRTATAATWCWRCSPNARRACRSPISCAVTCSSRPAMTDTAYLRSDRLPGPRRDRLPRRRADQRVRAAGRRQRRRRRVHDRRRRAAVLVVRCPGCPERRR